MDGIKPPTSVQDDAGEGMVFRMMLGRASEVENILRLPLSTGYVGC